MTRSKIALLAFLALVPAARGQPQLIGQLRANNPPQRMDAFYRLVSLGAPPGASPMLSVQDAISPLAQKSPELKAALIDALRIENAYLRQGLELGEEFSSYYGDLLLAVTALRDPRAVPALADAMGTGALVMNALAEFGRPAADVVLERLNRGVSRRSACVVLGRMLDLNNPRRITDPAGRKQIEDALVNASRNFGSLVRITALESLTKSDNPDLRKFAVDGLQSLAERTNGPAQAAAFHALRFMAETGNGDSALAQKLAVSSLGVIARRQESPFQQAAVAALNEVAKNGSGDSREAAVQALRDLPWTNRLQRLFERPR
jgi:hypothetical protein